jgi:hypothetical protein
VVGHPHLGGRFPLAGNQRNLLIFFGKKKKNYFAFCLFILF